MHEEHVTLINIYVPKQGALKYVKQLLTELKGETDLNTIIVAVSYTHLTLPTIYSV